MSRTPLQKGIDFATKASDEDKKRNFSEALKLYETAAEYFIHSLKYDAYAERTKQSIRERLTAYLDRAEQLKKYLRKKSGESEKDTKKPIKSNGDDNNGDEENPEKKKLVSQLQGLSV